jgi:hypothetical protein
MAELLRISPNLLPRAPDGLPDPKRHLVDLARRSGDRAIRDGLVPTQGSGRPVGTAYNAILIDFITRSWRPPEAAMRSDSLRRCLAAMDRLREGAT